MIEKPLNKIKESIESAYFICMDRAVYKDGDQESWTQEMQAAIGLIDSCEAEIAAAHLRVEEQQLVIQDLIALLEKWTKEPPVSAVARVVLAAKKVAAHDIVPLSDEYAGPEQLEALAELEKAVEAMEKEKNQ